MPYYDTATRAQALTLKLIGLTNKEIEERTGLKPRTVSDLLDRAVERGLDLNAPRILDCHVANAAKTGRPSKQAQFEEEVIKKVRSNRYGRELSCAQISYELDSRISPITVWRILRKAGFKKTKPTRKPGLTAKMRKERLEWCLAHKDWTLKDWKRVIWSDETSVMLGFRRGGYRVWRTSEERFIKSYIRERWKGYSEFMFWGCFSYDQKGPCHIWQKETAAEKASSVEELKALNQELELILKAEWELTNPMSRLRLDRQNPGRKPVWKWTVAKGKLTRGGGKGIDWWRYQKVILLPKLLPFAKKCGPDALVQEDRAPSHAHHAQARVYSAAGVQRLLWVPNSPDLNMIEPTWMWMKRETTKKGAPQSRKEAEKVWRKTWKELPQERIQMWIERIMNNVQEVIRLEGGNEYKEGRSKELKSRVSVRIVDNGGDDDDGDWEPEGLFL